MSQEIQFILYNLPNEDGKVQVIIKDETLWCTQKAMAQLFDVGVPAISKHLKNIFEEGELFADSVVSKMEITESDVNKDDFDMYCLQPAIRRRGIIKEQCHYIDAEFKTTMPEFWIKI